MVKCNRSRVRWLKRALRRTKTPVLRQRIQMVLLREAGMTQPAIAEAMGVSLSTVNRAHMAFDRLAQAQMPTSVSSQAGPRGAKRALLKPKNGFPRGVRRAARAAAARGRPLRVMFADEARFGRINRPRPCWAPAKVRPAVASQLVREYIY